MERPGGTRPYRATGQTLLNLKDSMPTLNWIGKEAVVNHHLTVPFRLLKDVPELSCGDPGSGNLIVEGDNLVALKALLPYYAGQVKCIYIDPPYNTGMDDRDEQGKRGGWRYSDNVNSPEIREWLGRVVGAESEDLSRHDKWLCMIYPRLALLKQFLRQDGVIFISLDDNEISSLRLVMDELFGRRNFIGCIVWKNTTDNNPTRIVTEHEYVIAYAADGSKLSKEWKSVNLDVKARLLEIGEGFIKDFPDQDERQKAYTKWFRANKDELWPFDRYKFIDDGGIYTGSQSVHNPGKEGYRFDIPHPKTGRPCKEPLMGYRFPPETAERLLSEGRVLFGEDHTKIIELKVYVKDYRAKLSSLFELDGRIGTNEIKALFPNDTRPFDFPKPTGLIEELLSFTTGGDDLILDSFAGSGTTGQAVLQLNQADGQNRRFILVEMKESSAKEITSERVRRVTRGYTNAKSEEQPGLGGGFRYCQLGEPLFDESGEIRKSVSFTDLARHVWFTETGEPLPKERVRRNPLLGDYRGTGIYLLYNGILADKSPEGGNVLTRSILADLPPFDGPRVIYCAGCRIGADRLRREGITIRQTPYEIKVS
jgi:DNA modification methylase